MKEFSATITWKDKLLGRRFEVTFAAWPKGQQVPEVREFSFMSDAVFYAQNSMVEALQGVSHFQIEET